MKNYNHLLVNGCSFSFGATLENIEQERYSSLLAKKLNCNVENISKLGGSNDRIFRTTFDWINKNKYSDTLIIIGLTEIFREDIFSNNTKKYTPMSYAYLNSKDDMKTFFNECGVNDMTEFFETNFQYFINKDEWIKKVNRNIILLNSYAKQSGVDIIFFDAMLRTSYGENLHQSDMKTWKENKDLFKLNNVNYFLFENYENWREYIKSWDDTYDYGHPQKNHHKDLTEKLYEYIRGEFNEKK